MREGINKLWGTHTMEHYSATKRKTVLTHATPSLNCEDISLGEINQVQKDKSRMTPLI